MITPRRTTATPPHIPRRADQRESSPIDDVARALGCNPTDTKHFRELLYELCRRCVIRYGLPDLVRDELGDALGVPKCRSLRHPPAGEQIDMRWARLAQALRLPPKGHLPLISLAEVTPSTVQAICAGTAELAHDFKSGRLSEINGPIALHLAGAASRIRSWGEDCREGIREITRPIAHRAARQLEIYHEGGAEWTLVSPEEQTALRACALAAPGRIATPTRPSEPVKPTVTTKPSEVSRTDRSLKPADALLKPFGLRWMWKDERGSWEPQVPNTNKPNASLFDHSSKYLEIQITHHSEAHHKELIGLLQSLKATRMRFEMERTQLPRSLKQFTRELLSDQNKILDRAMDTLAKE